MKFKKILMLNYSREDFNAEDWIRIHSLSEQVVLLPTEDPQIKKHLSDTDCLLVRLGATVDKEMIGNAPRLTYIGMLGTGYGRIDTKYASSKNICVCNISGYSTEGVAEFYFGILLDHIHDIARAKLQAKNGNYSESGFQVSEIKGKNFGVVGLGRIGRRIAQIAQAFGANVCYWSRTRKKDIEKNGVEFKKIEDILSQSDFISLNLAFNPETKNFLDGPKIQKIKQGAVVINLAPMEIVDIDSLEKRLQKNNMTFILDHSDELSPDQAKQLAKYDNCIMYPPIGYITKEAGVTKRKMFIDNLENFLREKPTNKVN